MNLVYSKLWCTMIFLYIVLRVVEISLFWIRNGRKWSKLVTTLYLVVYYLWVQYFPSRAAPCWLLMSLLKIQEAKIHFLFSDDASNYFNECPKTDQNVIQRLIFKNMYALAHHVKHQFFSRFLLRSNIWCYATVSIERYINQFAPIKPLSDTLFY